MILFLDIDGALPQTRYASMEGRRYWTLMRTAGAGGR